MSDSKQPKSSKGDKSGLATNPKRKSRVHTTEKPFTLHIDDTPENVARALFGKPLKR